MIDTEVGDLLMRMYAIWPNAMPPENRRKAVREEWQRLLGRNSASLLNEALDRYATSPAGKYMPKPGELLQISDNILEERQRRQSLDYSGKCPLCGDFRQVLVQAKPEALFYGHYVDLGIKCPCGKPGEMSALQQGLKITRKVRSGYLEIWLEYGRLFGRLKAFGRKENPVEPPPAVQQQSLKQAFNDDLTDDLPF